MNSFPLRRFPARGLPAIHTLHALCLTFVLLLLSAHSTAQYATIRPDSEDIPRIDIRGTVVNSATGEAIPRALVTLGGREAHSMLTDSDGGFTFEKVPAQDVYLQARRPGFFDRSVTFVRPESAKNLVVKMTPAGLIFGQVVDENGEPVESAQVRLLQQRMIVGKRKWVSANNAQTNNQGRYRLPNLRPGNYVVAIGPVMNTPFETGKTGYGTVFYPKAPDLASSTPIQVGAGEQSEANFELSKVPVFTLSGVVTGPKTQGVNVFLADSSGNEIGVFARQEPATGEFEIRGVPRGTYTVRARGVIDGGGEQLSGHTVVTVNTDVSGIALLLRLPMVIPVDVRTDSQQPPVSGPESRVPSVSIQAVSTMNEQLNGYTNFEGRPENGRLVLTLPESGAYNLSITSLGPGYVRSATSGSTDLLTGPLVIPAAGGVDPIEVVLASDGARVSGVVRGGSGHALIIAVPDKEGRQPSMTGSDFQGGFSFGLLAPGDYTFYALARSDQMDYSDLDVLKPFRSKAVHVSLSSNQTAQVTLDMIEPE